MLISYSDFPGPVSRIETFLKKWAKENNSINQLESNKSMWLVPLPLLLLSIPTYNVKITEKKHAQRKTLFGLSQDSHKENYIIHDRRNLKNIMTPGRSCSNKMLMKNMLIISCFQRPMVRLLPKNWNFNSPNDSLDDGLDSKEDVEISYNHILRKMMELISFHKRL